MTDKQFVIGRDNFALTIFIPVDCKNNCPFCTSKAEYKTNKPNLAKVIRAIKHVAEYDIPFKDIVITGGEPFADIDTLDCIISLLEDYFPDQKCYVNTSLPKNTLEEAIKYINDSYYIDGINVSRHLKEIFSEKVASDDDIARIKVSKHLNCVLFKEDVSDEDLINYCDRMCGLGQPTFRADYRTITQENLHSFEHKLFKKLDRLFGYVGSTQCHVCHTDRFENGCVLHRGVELIDDNTRISVMNSKMLDTLEPMIRSKLAEVKAMSRNPSVTGVNMYDQLILSESLLYQDFESMQSGYTYIYDSNMGFNILKNSGSFMPFKKYQFEDSLVGNLERTMNRIKEHAKDVEKKFGNVRMVFTPMYFGDKTDVYFKDYNPDNQPIVKDKLNIDNGNKIKSEMSCLINDGREMLDNQNEYYNDEELGGYEDGLSY